MAFVCEFQHTPFQEMIFFAMFHISYGYEIWEHVPNSLRNKSMERHIPYLLQKMDLWASKTLLYPSVIGEFYFFSTLNVIILQIVRNECVRFGGHVHI
jgi:hypothetical protein